MLQPLVQALVRSKNEAADDVLAEALRMGSDAERSLALGALLRRGTIRGLSRVVGIHGQLPEPLQQTVLQNIRIFHSALRECGRSDDASLRLGAMKLIALGRLGKLTYVLSESLHHQDETIGRSAVEAIVALARWVATETRKLQRGAYNAEAHADGAGDLVDASGVVESPAQRICRELAEQRPDIESAVARAMDVHRGAHGPDLLRAALFLADWPGSKTLAILHTSRHGGQSLMVRRLQQPPDSEHVEAFLLGAAHGGLRSQFGAAFAHIDQAPVLDALVRKTHWLKNHQLQLCVHQVSRGVWWGEAELARDLLRRDGDEAARVGEWISASGVHDGVQDQRLDQIRQRLDGSGDAHFAARLRLLRCAARRPRGASVALLKSFLADPDERLMRLAAREIVRRRPVDFENVLLQMMTSAPESVRRVISRAVGQAGFESFWTRYDRLDRPTRKAAGRAMLKILPDAVNRLSRRLSSGPAAQQLKAIQVARELGMIDSLSNVLQQLCSDPNPKVRSRAVGALGEMAQPPTPLLLDRILNDADARVRANAIEVLEQKQQKEYLPMLAQRGRSVHNRERANAIKAMHRMKVGTATNQLTHMLRDSRSEHRISAMWTLRQIGFWKLLTEVGRLAREDENLKVRRYAVTVLRDVAEMVRNQPARKAG